MKKEKKFLSILCSSQIQGQMRGGKGLIVCYAVCVMLFLTVKRCAGLWIFCGFQSGKYVQRNLTLHDFEQYGVEQTGDLIMVNATDDAQLWFTGDIYNLYVNCSFSYDPGEFLVFYSNRTDGTFSAERCVRGKLFGNDYVFEFPLGTKQIRMDTGIYPSITVTFEEILVNRYTFNTVMRFSAEDLFYWLIMPGLLYGMLDLLAGQFFTDVAFGETWDRSQTISGKAPKGKTVRYRPQTAATGPDSYAGRGMGPWDAAAGIFRFLRNKGNRSRA